MGRDRTEGAAAKAAPHDLHAVFHHLKRGNPSVAVGGMRPPGEVQAIHLIHLVLLERQGRRIDDDCLAAVSLHEPPRVVGIGLEVRDPRHLAEGERIGRDGLVGGEFKRVVSRRRRLAGPEAVGDTAEATQLLHRRAGVERPRDREHRPLPHSEDDQVGLGIEQDRTADRVAPVVVVGDAAETRLHAAGDDRHSGIRLPRPLAVGERGPVGPPADLAPRRIGVVVADLPIRRVVVDHRIHVAGRDPEEQPRPTELSPGIAAAPVGLGQHGHAEARRFQKSCDQAVGKTRVIDVGVTADEHDVDGIPAAGLHVGARRRERRDGGRRWGDRKCHGGTSILPPRRTRDGGWYIRHDPEVS